MYEQNYNKFIRYLNWKLKDYNPRVVHYIYTLSDPRDKKVRYVGQTNDPKSRLSAHKSKGHQLYMDGVNAKGVNAWLSNLASHGLAPYMDIYKKIICENGVNCSPSCARADQVEREIIVYFKDKLGAPLLNEKLNN